MFKKILIIIFLTSLISNLYSQIVNSGTVSISIFEETGPIFPRTFNISDLKLFEDIHKESSANKDFSTGALEYYDIYISDGQGKYDSLGNYVTIDCYHKPTNYSAGVGNNIDAVRLDFPSNIYKYANSITHFELGFSKPDTAFFDSLGWKLYILGPPDTRITRLGMFRTSITVGDFQTSTSINKNYLDVINDFKLNQNYPNPFNPLTTIEYSLNTSGKVKLEIYNNVGQKIRTVVNKNMIAGNYSVLWDGTNDKKETVSSGTYFYRLLVNDQFKIFKMILLR